LSRAQVISLTLESQGIDPNRFALEWVSSAEAARFARVVTDFTEKVRELGPNPLSTHRAQAA
jgi:F420-non-reducing hydrogenase iron-sulfur subunit